MSDEIPPEDSGWDAGGIKRTAADMAFVLKLLQDGQWWLLDDLSVAVGCPTQSVSAHIRGLRERRNGAWIIKREHVGGGLHRYQLTGQYPAGEGPVTKRGRKQAGIALADQAITFADELPEGTPLYDFLVEVAYHLDPS